MKKQEQSHNLFHIPILITGLGFWVYWLLHTPAPNKAVLLLTGVAISMALLEMRPYHKALYLLLVVGLMFIENRAINKDRKDYAMEQQKIRAEEARKFEGIGRDLTTAIESSEATMKDLKGTIKISTKIMRNTLPRAVIISTQTVRAETAQKDLDNHRLSFNAYYLNGGLATAKDVVFGAKTFVAPRDDIQAQNEIARKFNIWWSTTKHPLVGTVQMDETQFASFTSESFGDIDLKRIDAHKSTVYILLRWTYSDSTGKWVSDKCFYYQDPLKDWSVTHSCKVHDNHRYPLPKSIDTPIL